MQAPATHPPVQLYFGLRRRIQAEEEATSSQSSLFRCTSGGGPATTRNIGLVSLTTRSDMFLYLFTSDVIFLPSKDVNVLNMSK